MNDSQRYFGAPPPFKTRESTAWEHKDSSANSLTFYRDNEKQRPVSVSAAKWSQAKNKACPKVQNWVSRPFYILIDPSCKS